MIPMMTIQAQEIPVHYQFLSLPNITFGQHEVSQGDETYFALNQKPHVQVNDTRGGAKGWSLGVTLKPFVGENGNELTGAKMTLSNGKVVTKNNKSPMPKMADTSFELNEQYQDLMLAKRGARCWWTLLLFLKGKTAITKT